jgi:hypothetical protein
MRFLQVGLQYPNLVERSGSGIYCVISSGLPGKINAILCVIAALITLGLESKGSCLRSGADADDMCSLDRYPGPEPQEGVPGPGTTPLRHARPRPDLHRDRVCRHRHFACLCDKGLLAASEPLHCPMFVFFLPLSPLDGADSRAVPVAAFLIFGTQKDIIDVWLCRRSKHMPLETFNSRASASKV